MLGREKRCAMAQRISLSDNCLKAIVGIALSQAADEEEEEVERRVSSSSFSPSSLRD
jgi:hypothetical protein